MMIWYHFSIWHIQKSSSLKNTVDTRQNLAPEPYITKKVLKVMYIPIVDERMKEFERYWPGTSVKKDSH